MEYLGSFLGFWKPQKFWHAIGTITFSLGITTLGFINLWKNRLFVFRNKNACRVQGKAITSNRKQNKKPNSQCWECNRNTLQWSVVFQSFHFKNLVNREALCIFTVYTAHVSVLSTMYLFADTCTVHTAHLYIVHAIVSAFKLSLLWLHGSLLHTFIVLFTANVRGYPKQQTAGQGEEYIEWFNKVLSCFCAFNSLFSVADCTIPNKYFLTWLKFPTTTGCLSTTARDCLSTTSRGCLFTATRWLPTGRWCLFRTSPWIHSVR